MGMQCRSNIPYEYKPAGWPINIFSTPVEANLPKVH